MFEENLHLFQKDKDDASSWRKYSKSLYTCTSKNAIVTKKDHGTHKRFLIWNGVGICWQKAPLFMKLCNLSKGMQEIGPHFLYGISHSLKNMIWGYDAYWRILCKNAEPMSQLLFVCFNFVSFFSAFVLTSATFFRKLDENRWNTKLPSTHAQVSEHLILLIWGTRNPD